MKLLVTGGSGKLGREIVKQFPKSLHPSHRELDVKDAAAVKRYIAKNDVREVIHCAAIADVRYCEENRREAFRTNVVGTANLLKALDFGDYFIYISTACVFPGDEVGKLYGEDDLVYPKNFYSVTKLFGEFTTTHFRDYLQTLIIRTNFIEQGKWPYDKAFVDRFANYLYTNQVASRIKELYDAKIIGLRHIAGTNCLSMYQWATLYDSNVEAMTIDDYDGPPLTMNMCLRSVK